METMKIAVTCENGLVFQHFGKTPEFAIFEIEDGRIIAMKTEPVNTAGHDSLAQWLQERDVDVLICGGIGSCAQTALANANIRVVGGVSGDAVFAVGDYLKGCLEADPDFCCQHHHHHHHGEGDCHCDEHGEHSCGSHSCHCD